MATENSNTPMSDSMKLNDALDTVKALEVQCSDSQRQLSDALAANDLLIAENRRLKERVSDLEEGCRVQFAKIDALNAIIVGSQS